MILNRKEVGFAQDLKYSKPKMGSGVVFFFPCGIITATVNPVIQQVIKFNYMRVIGVIPILHLVNWDMKILQKCILILKSLFGQLGIGVFEFTCLCITAQAVLVPLCSGIAASDLVLHIQELK